MKQSYHLSTCKNCSCCCAAL